MAKKTYKGTVKRSTMAGGAAWELHTDGGEVYELDGDDKLLAEGAKVEIEGSVERDQMSITMTGPILEGPERQAGMNLISREIRMHFELKHTFDAPLDVVTREFLNPDLFPYLQKNMPKTMVAIDPVERNESDGAVKRKTRYKPKPLIKSIGPKKVTPEMMAWVEESEYDKTARTMRFQNIPDSGRLRSLLVNQGTITFKDLGGKTERTVSGELKVKVFLLGAIAEKIIFGNAKDILNEEAAAFTKWLESKTAANG